ncbi:alpha/beta hydrolase [Saccharicrinis aurantiacus]|uniref:alpha/beta hydrolase n=1 Tax=Saccharicrinis aurantiacus TaxID=1849719 RepID=UPI00083951F4|nr:alpha/beta hydrolase [Saccharicrinis aurantiacus]
MKNQEETLITEKYIRKNVNFKSVGSTIVGHLYFPKDTDFSKKYPAIVAGGPMATIKEQSPGVFAKALAERGFIALAFDYRTFGESEGEPRQYEDPASKTEDIQNAISFLVSHKNVDSNRIGALGICNSSSYIADALQSDIRVKAFGTVSGHFSLREATVTNPLVPEEMRKAMYAKSIESRQHYFETGVAEPDDMLMPDMNEAPPAEAGVFICEQYDYYFRRREAEWPTYTNHLVPFSFGQIARSHGLDYAGQIAIPYLGVVGEKAFTREFTERFIKAKTQGSAEIKIIKDGTHFSTYDRTEYVAEGADALSEFFNKHLV